MPGPADWMTDALPRNRPVPIAPPNASASVIQSAGPGIILGYAIAGFIAFLIMRQLGEMVVEEPVAGSFSHFAYKYWGRFAGFASGWDYWGL